MEVKKKNGSKKAESKKYRQELYLNLFYPLTSRSKGLVKTFNGQYAK